MKTRLPERIVFLTPAICGADGISMVCRQAVNGCRAALKHHSAELYVWSLAESAAEMAQLDGEGVVYRGASNSKVRFASWGLQQLLGKAEDTLVVPFHIGVAPVAFPLVARGAQMAVFIHGVEVWRRLQMIESYAIQRAEVVISNSDFTMCKFLQCNPQLSPKRTSVCHLGTPPVEPGGGQPCGDGFALIVGRMSSAERYKGHDELLEVWPDIIQHVPQAKLVIAGDGDDRGRLQAKCNQLGLASQVRFVGRVDEDQLATLYQQCEFFVMPSSGEGFGLVFLEAMLAGKACIGGDGAAAEIIKEGETGFVVDRLQHRQLKLKILQLFEEAETRQRMGRAGANRVKARFTERHFHDRFNQSLGLPLAG